MPVVTRTPFSGLLCTVNGVQVPAWVSLSRPPVFQHPAVDAAPNESEARFRALAEASWEGICFSDNGVILDANPQLATILGYEPGELIGRRVIDLVTAESTASMLRAMRVRSAEPNEFKALRKDGSVISVEVRAQTVSYQGRPVRMTAVRDVTDYTRAAERRRALVAGTAGVAGQHFFHSLVKHLARALETRCALVAELLEPEHTQLHVLSAWDGDDHVTIGDAPLADTIMRDVLNSGMQFYGQAGRPFADDGALGDLDVTNCAAISLQDASGRAIGVLAVAGDRPLRIDDNLVSTLRVFAARAGVEIERIRGERQVKRFQSELEQRVADRTRELEQANLELEAFSYSVSHDLRAPLRQIRGFVDLLERDLGEPSACVRQHLADIADSAKRMATLVDTLLEFSRVGRADLNLVEVDLGWIVAEVIGDLELSPDRHIEWQLHPLPAVTCDPVLMRQVWANLIGNAVKFTRPRTPARIEIGSFEADEGVVCFVRDNGVGFNMQRADKLFGVFQRLHPPSRFEGTGIGLANVQRIIVRHGGRVWAFGEVDRGATFHFSLPEGKSTGVPS
jgi:PAS domain S-box-containing protein